MQARLFTHPAAARQRFVELSLRPDPLLDLVEASLVIALEEYPALDVDGYLRRVDAWPPTAHAVVLGVVRLVLLHPALEDRVARAGEGRGVLVRHDGHAGLGQRVQLVVARPFPQTDEQVDADLAVGLGIGGRLEPDGDGEVAGVRGRAVGPDVGRGGQGVGAGSVGARRGRAGQSEGQGQGGGSLEMGPKWRGHGVHRNGRFGVAGAV